MGNELHPTPVAHLALGSIDSSPVSSQPTQEMGGRVWRAGLRPLQTEARWRQDEGDKLSLKCAVRP